MQQERAGDSTRRTPEFRTTQMRDPFAHAGRCAPQTSKVAVVALVMATLSFVILPLNFIAIFFGVIARREIQHSRGRLKSEPLAVTAIVLGSTSLVAMLLAAGIVTIRALTTEPPKDALLTTSAPVVVSTPVEPVPDSPSPLTDQESSFPVERKANVEHVGQIVIAAIDPEVKSLFESIDRQRALAHAERRELLLWLVAADCRTCAGVEESFTDAKLQHILSGSRVVRLDVRQFEAELRQLRIPVRQFPAFVRINLDNNPIDYISADEWGSNTAVSIAPVLEDFLKGHLKKRHHTWRDSEQDEETAI